MASVEKTSSSSSSQGKTGLWCGIAGIRTPAFRKAKRRAGGHAAHVSAVHSVFDRSAQRQWKDADVSANGTDDTIAARLQTTQDLKCFESSTLDAYSRAADKPPRNSIPPDVYMRLVCGEEGPLSALLRHPRLYSPLEISAASDGQKLAWLRSQLVGSMQEFPTPFGIRQLVYADHTASGRSVGFIEHFMAEHVLPFYGNTHTDDSYVGSRTSMMVRRAEEYIKERLGGSKEDALLMCGWGCTAAIKRLQEVMGIAVPSVLRDRVFKMMEESSTERWLVFTGPYEHHSNLLSWRQTLAEVREVPADEEGMIDMGRLEDELRAAKAAGRRRILGTFSACSNVTGLLTDTRAIARLLHSYGALACFDFAAAAPHMGIEMRARDADGYDALVMSPHKLLGGQGAPGLLLMHTSLYMLGSYPPSTCGGGTTLYVNGFNEKDTLYREKIEEREEGGTPPILGKIRCALAFWLKEAMGVDSIARLEASYVMRAMDKLSMYPNIRVLGNNPSTRAPILSFLIQPSMELTREGDGKPLHGRFVVKLLNDLFGIQGRGGCACAGPYGHLLLGIDKELSLAIRSAILKGYEGLKPGWARVSFCYSMTEEEVDFIVLAMGFLARYGHRYLALYEFDWRSGDWAHSKERCLQYGLNAASVNALAPERKKGSSPGERFRHYLQQAQALAQLLPKCPPPRPPPDELDPNLLLFQV